MDITQFEKVKTEFGQTGTERKVEMYVSAEGLTQEQYKELLRMFPPAQLHLIEEALS